MTLPELLNKCYREEQPWQEFYMSDEDAKVYFLKMIERGNIISICDQDELLGYCEFWRLNFEQFGRLVCNAPFYTLEETTENGPICFVANVWIKEHCRKGLIFKALEELFFKMNNSCDYYAGFAWRKRTKPTKVFKRDKLKSALFNFRS